MTRMLLFITIIHLVCESTEKDLNGNFLTLFPFQPTASVCKEVRPRSKHISRQHRNRASLYTTAAVNNPLKFLQHLWTKTQSHWEALADSEEFQAKPTFPPSLTVSTAYTADVSLRSTSFLHRCSRNHLLSLHSRIIHFLYHHLRLSTSFSFLLSTWENKTNQHEQNSYRQHTAMGEILKTACSLSSVSDIWVLKSLMLSGWSRV